ncbi:HNH endonuclease [Stenotrophomonas maltophilia]|uniref:HNH endonuclease n=1 Tax=Stenotrophomonas maltophilia TaxID=40324 RepID=UPI000A507C83|nr:hypothetical protein [Stenotrophomonas maltophilia]
MDWIDFALAKDEASLREALTGLPVDQLKLLKSQLLSVLGADADEYERSTIRILIERTRAFALPLSLWTRPLDASWSIRDAGVQHLVAHGLLSTEERLVSVQGLYQRFRVRKRSKGAKINQKKLEAAGFRCQICGLRFCNEDLEKWSIVSPHGYRGTPKPDPLKIHWTSPAYLLPSIDHDWPISTYGDNSPENQKVVCTGCNGGKANFVALEQTYAWTGILEREQLEDGAVSTALFYAQLRRHPRCSRTGATAETTELSVNLKDPAKPVVLDNLITVTGPNN